MPNYILGHYVPRQLIEKLKWKVHHGIPMKEFVASLYLSSQAHLKALKEAFETKAFLKTLATENGLTTTHKDSGFRTLAAYYTNKTLKERAQRTLRKTAHELSLMLHRDVGAYQVASALVYLYGVGAIEIEIK